MTIKLKVQHPNATTLPEKPRVPTKSMLIDALHMHYNKAILCYAAAHRAVKRGMPPLEALKLHCPTITNPEAFVETICRHPNQYRLRRYLKP